MKPALLAALLLAAAPAHAADADERKAILGVLDRFFAAMTAKDAATINALSVPGSVLVSVKPRADNGQLEIVQRSTADFAAMIAKAPGTIVERIYDPEVRVRGPVASAIAGYTFDRDGKRSHCGTDIVDFVKDSSGWRISGFTYSMMTDNCPK